MLTFARPDDREELFHIWKQCFGDDDRYINFYFDTAFAPDQTPVLRLNGTIAAMMRLFSCSLRVGEQVFPLQYVYAAATLPEFQGQGCMRRLMEEVGRYYAARGDQGIVLIPGSMGLFGFYEKLGFSTRFYRRVENVRLNEQDLDADGVLTDLSFPEFLQMRREYAASFPAFVEHGEDLARYVYKELHFSGGKMLKFQDKSGQSYGVCYMIGKKTALAESNASGAARAAFLSALLREESARSALSADYAPSRTEGAPYGMLRCLSSRLSQALEALPRAPYMGCMLDD